MPKSITSYPASAKNKPGKMKSKVPSGLTDGSSAHLALKFIEGFALKHLATPTTEEIADHLRVSERRARDLVTRLETLGHVTKPNAFTYRLTSPPARR